MKRFLLLLCVVAAVGALAQSGMNPLHKLAWLAGDWRLQSGSTIIEERWTGGEGGMMVGLSRTIRNGSTASFEFLRIESRDGGVFYVAQPNGGAPTEFRLISSTDTELVFENLQHDFPQRIRYRRTQAGLTARIENAAGTKHEDFAYTNATCR